MLGFWRFFFRYGRSFAEVKRGNFWGLPVNFSGVFGGDGGDVGTAGVWQMITDPIDTVQRIDATPWPPCWARLPLSPPPSASISSGFVAGV